MPAPTAAKLAEALRPVTQAPAEAALFCDIDGVLAPIVGRAEEAQVPEGTSRLLAGLARRYRCVACVSGRSAAEARRLVRVGGLVYAGTHGAELLEPGATRAILNPELDGWSEQVRGFAAERDRRDLRSLRVRIEDKGPIVAFHWRGAPDEQRAHVRVEEIAGEAEAAGLRVHWGRKVLEVRPPVEINKGQAVRELTERFGAAAALFGGDDATDVDAFDALDALQAEGRVERTVRVGVRSDEGPPAIVERADLVVDGVNGFASVLEALSEA